MKKVGIIGAGNMGSGIVQKTAQEGLSVVMVDMKPEFVQRGFDLIRGTLQEAVERKIMTPEKVEEIMGRIQGTTDYADVKDCDLVIEAVFEDMDIKKGLLKKLDGVCDPKTILATNTSSFSVTDLAEATNRPDRVAGLHFFYHPAKNRLLEIIPGDKTSTATTAACKKYSQLTGKTDILVKDAPGFAVNRFFVPWLNEATRILEEGVATIPTIEKAGKDSLGIGMGPFELMNVTGVPIALHSSTTLGEKLGTFYSPSAKLREQTDSGASWSLGGDVEEDKLQAVADRLLGVVFFVSCELLQEGISDIADTDLGAKVGLRWAKGPFQIMNELGMEKAYELVEKLVTSWPEMKIPDPLVRQKQEGIPWEIPFVKYSRDGDVSRVTISRPDAMNALNATVVKQLDEAFKKADADPDTKAVILDATGKAFVAGADMKFFIQCIKENRLDDNLAFTTYGQEVLQRIDDSEKLVVAKMEGMALGGGFEYALSADVIVASTKALMGFPETGLGIYPGMGGTQRPSRFIGKVLAKYLVFTGRLLSGEEAERIGLVDYVFAPNEIEDKIKAMLADGTLKPNKGRKDEDLPEEWRKIKVLFADENIPDLLKGTADASDPLAAKTLKILGKKGPIALKLANEIMDEGYDKPVAEATKIELRHLNEIFSTKDALMGLQSVGKAAPAFEGK